MNWVEVDGAGAGWSWVHGLVIPFSDSSVSFFTCE